MTQLLIQGQAILAAGPLTVTDSEIQAPDVIFPRHVLGAWEIVEAQLPPGFSIAGFEWDGAHVVARPAPPAPSLTVDDYVAAVQAMLDGKAQERRYYNIISACTYATSTNATFKAEAEACLAWRDAVWAKCYDLLDQVGAGTLAQPTIPELLAMLPTMTWPT